MDQFGSERESFLISNPEKPQGTKGVCVCTVSIQVQTVLVIDRVNFRRDEMRDDVAGNIGCLLDRVFPATPSDERRTGSQCQTDKDNASRMLVLNPNCTVPSCSWELSSSCRLLVEIPALST
jgi:hypothetical protein